MTERDPNCERSSRLDPPDRPTVPTDPIVVGNHPSTTSSTSTRENTTVDGTTEPSCTVTEVDGEPVRVHGHWEDASPEAVAALAEVIRAAKRRYAAEHPDAVSPVVPSAVGEPVDVVGGWVSVDGVPGEDTLNEIEARLEAATPGPWIDWGCGVYGPTNVSLAFNVGRRDAEFIAHARQDVPVLLAEVRRLRGQVQRVQAITADDIRDEIAGWVVQTGYYRVDLPSVVAAEIARHVVGLVGDALDAEAVTE